VLGAESTGKTTLCRDLAAHYAVPFVPEFGRWYTEAMPAPKRYTWTTVDFVTIATAQNRFEDDAATRAGPLLICDTSSFVTAVFEEAYLGSRSAGVEALHRGRSYGLYLLTDPETAFEPDGTGLRDAESRRWMHETYEAHVMALRSPVLHVSGTREARLQAAMGAVDGLLGERARPG